MDLKRKPASGGDIFPVKFDYDNDGRNDGVRGWKRYLAELWIMKLEEIV